MTTFSYRSEFYVDAHSVEMCYRQHGEALLGYFRVSDSLRYKAVRYNPEQYRLQCRSPSRKHFRHIYHTSRDLSLRGTTKDRNRFSLDLHKYAVTLPEDEYARVAQMLKSGADCSNLNGFSRELSLGLRYSAKDLNRNKGSLGRYMRGFYFQAGHSEAGIVLGWARCLVGVLSPP
jgi:hypothetical protein